MDDRVDAAIAALYSCVFDTPFATFKDCALTALRPVLPFTSAIWGSGIASTNTTLNIAFVDQPTDAIADYALRWQAQDFVRAATVANPGIAYRNEDCMPLDAYHRTPIYREYSRPRGIEHALCIVAVDEGTDLGELIYLFRADPAAAFTDAERDLLQRLLPHLASAWAQRERLNVLEHRCGGPADSQPGFAVLDDGGLLHATDRCFVERLRQTLPTWSGPTLPIALLDAFASADGTIRFGPCEARLLRGRDRHVLTLGAPAAPTLTPAERRVAALYATGRTKVQIAATLGSAPATVSNQLAAVYRKLGVHDKLALARKLDRLG